MANLRAGLLGLGMMGRNHARVLASLDGVDLVGIADPTGGVAGAAPHGVPVVGTLEELLALGIDYAMVSTPTQYHRDTALALAAAGVHALIEKPLTTDVRVRPARSPRPSPRPGWSARSATSSATTLRCSRPDPGSPTATWARSTRSPPAARAPSLAGSPTSGSSSTWPRTTST